MFRSEKQKTRASGCCGSVTLTLLTLLTSSALSDVVHASPAKPDSLPLQTATTSANTGAALSTPSVDEMSTMVASLKQQIVDQQVLLQTLQQSLAERSRLAGSGEAQHASVTSSINTTPTILSPPATSEPVKTSLSSDNPSRAQAVGGSSSGMVASEMSHPSQNSAPITISRENTVGSSEGGPLALPQPLPPPQMTSAPTTPVNMPSPADHPSLPAASEEGSSDIAAPEGSPPIKNNALVSQENTAGSTGGVSPDLPQTVKPEEMPPAAPASESTQSTVPAVGEDMTLSTEAQRQAYASGATVWREIERSVASQNALGIRLDERYVMAGIQDTASHHSLKMAPEEIDRTMDNLNSDYIRRANETRRQQEAEGKAYRIAFSKQNGTKKDAGAWYRIDDPGRGRHLRTTDTVVLQVTGTLPNGRVFEASGLHGQVHTARVACLLPSVAIGLQKVASGGVLTVVVPPGKAYGDAGFLPAIPGGATLIFNITVQSVKEKSDKVNQACTVPGYANT